MMVGVEQRIKKEEGEEVWKPWTLRRMKESWSTAGSPRGIMTVILQCISSYSAQTA